MPGFVCTMNESSLSESDVIMYVSFKYENQTF